MHESRRNILLKNLLSSMLDEWSADELIATIRGIVKEGGEHDTLGRVTRRGTRPASLDYFIRSLNASPIKQKYLRALADRYRNRAFLRSIGDVRHFLEMRGVHGDSYRDRAAASRSVLEVASRLSEGELFAIVDGTEFAGPSELGPLSDAIKEVGSKKSRD